MSMENTNQEEVLEETEQEELVEAPEQEEENEQSAFENIKRHRILFSWSFY